MHEIRWTDFETGTANDAKAGYIEEVQCPVFRSGRSFAAALLANPMQAPRAASASKS
jgi:hypothetical protein